MSEALTPPQENIARGLNTVEIPELGEKITGKVRDIWRVDHPDLGPLRVMVTTDRLSAHDRNICTVPQKGAVLNLTSDFWFDRTQDIVGNHRIYSKDRLDMPHPNVTIVKEAAELVPVEMVIRGYITGTTKTSIGKKYFIDGEREMYGQKFPDGLQMNQRLPVAVITPTTKAEKGDHDGPLTLDQAAVIVDSQFGEGTYARLANVTRLLFARGQTISAGNGLILVDTKYEFGFDRLGNLMLIDEVHTPDSSRYWLAQTYDDKFAMGEEPDRFDKDVVRNYLKTQGYSGEGPVPVVGRELIDQTSTVYIRAYEMITGREWKGADSDPDRIKTAVLKGLEELTRR